MDTGPLADEAEKLLAGGFKALKLRLGYPTLKEDLAAVHAVRRRIGETVLLMVDYNQMLDLDEALTRGRALDAENIYWFEEPIRHDDYAGAARLARELKMPVQLGENFSLPAGMATALEHKAADYVMPDLERIGGVTGWRIAAALADVNRIKMSSHCFLKSARICWRRRRPAISSNTSIGRTCSWKSRLRSSTDTRCRQSGRAMEWSGNRMRSKILPHALTIVKTGSAESACAAIVKLIICICLDCSKTSTQATSCASFPIRSSQVGIKPIRDIGGAGNC